MGRLIVLDTNCLLQSLSRRSPYYRVWEAFVMGKYSLCVTTEILAEYEEIIASHMSPSAAKLTIEIILRAVNVKCIPFPHVDVMKLSDFYSELESLF